MTVSLEREPQPGPTVLRTEPAVGEVAGGPREPSGASLVTARILGALALLVGWVLLYVFVLSGLEQARTQQGLYARVRTEFALGSVPTTLPLRTGVPIALIDAPAAGIHRNVVVEGTGPALLEGGPGHLRSTVLPGQRGTSVIAGRSVTFGAPFAGVEKLSEGAAITVTTGQGTFHFAVRDVRHDGDPIPGLPASGARLVLVTSTGSGWSGSITPSDTVFVDADLDGPAKPAANPDVRLDSSEQAFGIDDSTSTILELVLALQLLAAVLVAVTWARARWSAAAAWVGGTPLVIGALWICSDLAVRLLPNLM